MCVCACLRACGAKAPAKLLEVPSIHVAWRRACVAFKNRRCAQPVTHPSRPAFCASPFSFALQCPLYLQRHYPFSPIKLPPILPLRLPPVLPMLLPTELPMLLPTVSSTSMPFMSPLPLPTVATQDHKSIPCLPDMCCSQVTRLLAHSDSALKCILFVQTLLSAKHQLIAPRNAPQPVPQDQ